MRVAIGSSCVCFGVYLLFAGTVSMSEVATGIVLSMVGGGGAAVLTAVSGRRFTFSTAHGAAWGRALSGVPAATLRTGEALFGALFARAEHAGRADTRAFREGPAEAPRDRARRVTAVLAMSLSPATFVVHTEQARDAALLHGIGRLPPATNPEWLA